MKALQENYDWIGMGDHPAIYWAALQFQRLGLRVLVVPRWVGMEGDETRESSSYESKSYESNYCPLFLYPEAQPIQILTQDRRVALKNDPETWQQEYRLNYGSQPLVACARLKDFIKGIGFVVRGHDLSPVLPDDLEDFVTLACSQTWIPEGRDAVRKKLRGQIEAGGGHVVSQQLGKKIFLDSKGFQGIQLGDASAPINASLGMLGLNVEWAQSLVSTAAKNPLQGIRSEPQAWWFGVQFKIRDESIPPGITGKMIYACDGAPVIEIEHQVKRKVWIARTLVPFQSISLSREYQRKIAQRMFKVMEQIFPFIEYSILEMLPDIRDPEQVENFDLVRMYPFRDLAHVPPKSICYGGKGLGYRTPCSGLTLAYEESYPRIGDRGVYLAAAQSVAAWAKSQKKPPPDEIKFLLDLGA